MGLSPDPKEDEEKIRRAMEITHTYKHRDKPVSELSGGQKQRVWIAMALAQDIPFSAVPALRYIPYF